MTESTDRLQSLGGMVKEVDAANPTPEQMAQQEAQAQQQQTEQEQRPISPMERRQALLDSIAQNVTVEREKEMSASGQEVLAKPFRSERLLERLHARRTQLAA